MVRILINQQLYCVICHGYFFSSVVCNCNPALVDGCSDVEIIVTSFHRIQRHNPAGVAVIKQANRAGLTHSHEDGILPNDL